MFVKKVSDGGGKWNNNNKKKSVVFAVFRSVWLKIAQWESDQRAAEREE